MVRCAFLGHRLNILDRRNDAGLPTGQDQRPGLFWEKAEENSGKVETCKLYRQKNGAMLSASPHWIPFNCKGNRLFPVHAALAEDGQSQHAGAQEDHSARLGDRGKRNLFNLFKRISIRSKYCK